MQCNLLALTYQIISLVHMSTEDFHHWRCHRHCPRQSREPSLRTTTMLATARLARRLLRRKIVRSCQKSYSRGAPVPIEASVGCYFNLNRPCAISAGNRRDTIVDSFNLRLKVFSQRNDLFRGCNT